MSSHGLVRILGFPATLLHGDLLVLDRWLWLIQRLPKTRNQERLIDIGCGSGAFTIGASLRGYRALGLSWDERNHQAGLERAKIVGAPTAAFSIQDVRLLDQRRDLEGCFDIAICCENIEHVIDDRKLMIDIARCLKPGGRLLLTAPYLLYRPITVSDQGPFSIEEDGGHVRRGYTQAMLRELLAEAKLDVEEFSSCSGFLSQKSTGLWRWFQWLPPMLHWALVLPLRPFPPLFDGLIARMFGYPDFSICVHAYKPRHRTDAV